MGNKNATVATNTESKTKVKLASSSTKDASTRRRANIKMVQNVLLIWLDENFDENRDDCRNTVTQLRRVVNDINTFTTGDQCIQFVNTIKDNKACMIITGSLGQHIVPRVHQMPQVDSIFIFCGNKKLHEQWAKEWPKIKGVFTKITPICEALEQASQQCEHNAISMSFVSTNGDAASKNLDRLDPMFMYTQITKEILLTINFEQHHIDQFIEDCRAIFRDNKNELKNIEKFERTYRDQTPIWWYSYDCFLYRMVNGALRTADMDMIIKMGFFIVDLHRQIQELHQEQFSDHPPGKTFILYRGQHLSNSDFDQVQNTKGGLMSFNNFLSTSENRKVSLDFVDKAVANPDLVSILFVMTIDPTKSSTPFASINGLSEFPKEDEILFSMHSIFRIRDIKPMGENQRRFRVDLKLTSDDDKDLRTLTDHIREETLPDSEGWRRLGSVLLQMSKFDKAEQVYQALLDQTMKDSERALIYHQLGWAKDGQGEYNEAITFYEKSIEIEEETAPCNDLNLAMSYNNIGNMYSHVGDYSKALLSHEKALLIRQQSLPSSHPDLAMSYNNIGNMYYRVGEYSKALSSYKKALAIQQQSLPSNHHNLAKSYITLGNVFYSTNVYQKAITFYEKALAIQQQSLLSNHPDMAMSYNNIANVHYSLGEYSKALLLHEKALVIRQQSLLSSHPDLAMSYNNISLVHEKMGNYSKAHSFYERAVNIAPQLLPSNHPNLVDDRNNLDHGQQNDCESYF